MVFPLWKSLHSLNLMLPKEDRKAILLRLFNDDTPLVNLTQKRVHNNTRKAEIKVEDAGFEQEEAERRHNSSSEDEDGGKVPINSVHREDRAGIEAETTIL